MLKTLQNLPFSIGIDAENVVEHKDPINNTVVSTDIFIDVKTGASFGVDSTFVEQAKRLVVNNPYLEGDKIFLFLGGEKNSAGDVMRVDGSEFDQTWLNIIALSSLIEANTEKFTPYVAFIKQLFIQLLECTTNKSNFWPFQLIPMSQIDDIISSVKPLTAVVTESLHINSEKLFVVIPEQPSFVEWVNSLPEAQTQAELWTEHNISGDTGFDETEAAQIHNLDKGQSLNNFTESNHIIIRIQ